MGHIAVGLSHSVTELFFFLIWNLKIIVATVRENQTVHGWVNVLKWLNVKLKLTEQVNSGVATTCQGVGMCDSVRWGEKAGLLMSSQGCSCLLTSLPQDSWEQLQGPTARDRERVREGSLVVSGSHLLLSFFFFKSLCVFLHLFLFLNSFRENRPVS